MFSFLVSSVDLSMVALCLEGWVSVLVKYKYILVAVGSETWCHNSIAVCQIQTFFCKSKFILESWYFWISSEFIFKLPQFGGFLFLKCTYGWQNILMCKSCTIVFLSTETRCNNYCILLVKYRHGYRTAYITIACWSITLHAQKNRFQSNSHNFSVWKIDKTFRHGVIVGFVWWLQLKRCSSMNEKFLLNLICSNCSIAKCR